LDRPLLILLESINIWREGSLLFSILNRISFSYFGKFEPPNEIL
jgi:hypothetical protein